jgi:hypothetical protein
MSLRTILEVEIDDSRFRKFRELFDSYQKTLEKVPGAWKEVNKQTQANKTLVDQLIAAAAAQGNTGEQKAATARKIESSLRGSSKLWEVTAGSVDLVGKHISNITSKLAKWTTLTTAFTGLLGGGSLWGIDKLAEVIANNRRTAMGLGSSYGSMNSFNLNYSRLINTGSFLNNISNARFDITSPAYRALISLGINPNKIRNSDTSDLAQETVTRIHQLFAGTKPGMVGAKAQAYGVDQLMSLQEIVAISKANPEELKRIAGKYKQDSKTMGVGDAAQRKWQDLVTALDRAGRRIQAVFMDKLAALEPALEKLSSAVVDAVAAFANSGVLEQWITAISGGLGRLADFIDSPEFQKDVRSFGAWLAEAVKTIWRFVAAFGGKVGDAVGTTLDGAVDPSYKKDAYVPLAPDYGAAARGPSSSPHSPKADWNDTSNPPAGGSSSPPLGSTASTKALWLMGQLQKDYNLTPEQAAGAVGWMMGETAGTMRPDIVRPGGEDTGWAQWVGSRRQELLARGPLTDASNYAQIKHELDTNYSGVLEHLRQAKTVDEALYDWGEYYEGAGGTPGGMEYNYQIHRPFGHRVLEDYYKSAGKVPRVVVRPNTGANPHTAGYLANQYSVPQGSN